MATPSTLTLHALLGEHAVLQQGKPVIVSGTAHPGARVEGGFSDDIRSTMADCNGHWTMTYLPRKAGGPQSFSVTSQGYTLTRSDWMFGEVWLCSGQSNMEWTVAMLSDDEEIPETPLVRCFSVPRIPAEAPATETDGSWLVASQSTVGQFSAVAWYFARELSTRLKCPVGVIVPAFGGTRIISWMPKETLAARTEYLSLIEEPGSQLAEELQPHTDLGRSEKSQGWESPACVDEDWEELQVPGFWQDQGWQLNGAVWYRKQIELPESWRGQELVLHFGACDDFDETFVNGTKVGGVDRTIAGAYATPRAYNIDSSLSSSGVLCIAVRVFDEWGFGGIVRDAKLSLAGFPEETLCLQGTWKARVESAFPLRSSSRPIPASVLFQGMIHPIKSAALAGFLWYQGESDVERAALYPRLLTDLISSWRAVWGPLPFGIVQLTNYKDPEPNPGESAWAELREAQREVALKVPRCGLAVTIDLGEADNIHPRRKQPVGERLALWALAEVYAAPLEPWGCPVPIAKALDHSSVVIKFSHVGDGLRIRDGQPLTGFQIAGGDRHWVWANVEIIAPDCVRISHDEIASPVAVRYGWQNNPLCPLENSAGFPASPFRTDDWPLSTATH